MKPLVLSPTTQTPRVDFNAKTGLLKLEGRSWSEDVTLFYAPLINWFNDYAGSAKPETSFHLSMEYFNSASSKMIYQLFMKLITVVDKGNKVTVNWYYQFNDEEMLEAGKEYISAIRCSSDLFDFKLIGIEEYS